MEPQTSVLVTVLIFLLFLGCEYPPSADDDVGDGAGTDTTTGPSPSCENDEDCQNPATPICDEGTCVACVSDNQCDEPYPDCINGWCAKPCDTDELETNDTPMTATELSITEDYDLWLCAGDEDWFEITVTGKHFVSIVTNSDSMDGDLDIFLLDESSNVLDLSTSKFYGRFVPRAVEAIHNKIGTPTGSATYRIRVAHTIGPGGLPYRLSFLALKAG